MKSANLSKYKKQNYHLNGIPLTSRLMTEVITQQFTKFKLKLNIHKNKIKMITNLEMVR